MISYVYTKKLNGLETNTVASTGLTFFPKEAAFYLFIYLFLAVLRGIQDIGST